MNRWLLMCANLPQASSNRDRVAQKSDDEYWRRLERRVRRVPLGKPMPRGIPVDTLPYHSALDKDLVGRGTMKLED